MNNFNFTVLEGNLTKDPVKKIDFVEMVIETKRQVNGAEEIDFFNIRLYDKLADVCLKYLKKGSRVLVSGILRTEFIKGKEVNFLSPKGVK